jgi:hypothetical protein
MSKVLAEKPATKSQQKPDGPWTATVLVDTKSLKYGTIEVFCIRNLPAEAAYRVRLATFAPE